ncbi:MAG: glutathione S-transferase N-terminal domain-containing protein [Blastomonas sp.]
MKLHWSPASPYVRKVMVCAHALGLSDQMYWVRSRVAPTRTNVQLMEENPLNKIPTLVTDDGQVLYDSRVICEYLDMLAGGGMLFPADPDRRWQALTWQALADGLADIAVARRDEYYRGDGHRSIAHQKAFATKMTAALDLMERSAPALQKCGLNIGTIAIGVALGYLDFRPVGEAWREGRPALSAWEAEFSQRPAMLATPLKDQGAPPKIPFYTME